LSCRPRAAPRRRARARRRRPPAPAPAPAPPPSPRPPPRPPPPPPRAASRWTSTTTGRCAGRCWGCRWAAPRPRCPRRRPRCPPLTRPCRCCCARPARRERRRAPSAPPATAPTARTAATCWRATAARVGARALRRAVAGRPARHRGGRARRVGRRRGLPCPVCRRARCAAVLAALLEDDRRSGGYFYAPVTEAVAPGYFNVISRPGALADVAARLARSAYDAAGTAGTSAMRADCELIVRNALVFNTPQERCTRPRGGCCARWARTLRARCPWRATAPSAASLRGGAR
jgi:hypothetical protein